MVRVWGQGQVVHVTVSRKIMLVLGLRLLRLCDGLGLGLNPGVDVRMGQISLQVREACGGGKRCGGDCDGMSCRPPTTRNLDPVRQLP